MIILRQGQECYRILGKRIPGQSHMGWEGGTHLLEWPHWSVSGNPVLLTASHWWRKRGCRLLKAGLWSGLREGHSCRRGGVEPGVWDDS